MNKLELKKNIIAQQQQAILELKDKIDTLNSMVDLDEGDTIDPEDLSHQSEAKETKNIFDQKLLKAKANLTDLQKMDFSGKDSAIPGAVITTEKFNFFLGYSIFPFDFEDKKIIGISVESPMYYEIKNKKVGDQFSYSQNNYTILEIN